MRLKLEIAYDGRPYGGWQSQPNADTIQDRIESAIQEVAKQKIRITGSGRTDAGVHATAQIATFDVPEEISMNPFNWVPALNTKLPPSIRIMSCEEVPADFHARFSAKEKCYEYTLCLAPVLPPLQAGLAWHLPRQLDPISLEQAMNHLCGNHDFRAFAANRGNETEETNYHRTIHAAKVLTTDNGYILRFQGDGFLYKMVRLLVGAVTQVAQGRLRMDDFESLLNQAPNLPYGKSPYCAPPDGLSLKKVIY